MDEYGTIDGGRLAGGPDVAPEDEERVEDDETRDDALGVERRVGLGRVLEDHLSTGSPDPDDPGGPDAPPAMRDAADSSEGSFPASDPPARGSDPATTR
jgi:hypothetical protein